MFSLKTVTNLFLANSDFKFTGNGFSLPQLDSGISGKTNELGMKQGQLDSKKIWRRDWLTVMRQPLTMTAGPGKMSKTKVCFENVLESSS